MANEHLAIYLSDHLAGSTAAVELLEHLKALYPGTDMARFLVALQGEIAADRGELVGLMKRLQIGESRPRTAAAWIAGKFTELKLRLDDHARGSLYLLESLEAIGLGIDGKLALWRALNTATSVNPALQGVDYERLENRAKEQREAVEKRRLEAARAGFMQVQQSHIGRR